TGADDVGCDALVLVEYLVVPAPITQAFQSGAECARDLVLYADACNGSVEIDALALRPVAGNSDLGFELAPAVANGGIEQRAAPVEPAESAANAGEIV